MDTLITNLDLTQIVVALIGLLGIIITSVIVPMIKANTTEHTQKIIADITINNTVMDIRVMDDLYNQTADGVEIILKNRYKMTTANAKNAVSTSPLKKIFEKHGDIVAHTSCESLARDIYEYWKRNHHDD